MYILYIIYFIIYIIIIILIIIIMIIIIICILLYVIDILSDIYIYELCYRYTILLYDIYILSYSHSLYFQESQGFQSTLPPAHLPLGGTLPLEGHGCWMFTKDGCVGNVFAWKKCQITRSGRIQHMEIYENIQKHIEIYEIYGNIWKQYVQS